MMKEALEHSCQIPWTKNKPSRHQKGNKDRPRMQASNKSEVSKGSFVSLSAGLSFCGLVCWSVERMKIQEMSKSLHTKVSTFND